MFSQIYAQILPKNSRRREYLRKYSRILVFHRARYLVLLSFLSILTISPIKLVLSQLAMYANDSTLYCISPNSSNTSRCEVAVSLNNDLESVLKWGNDWLVTFNAKKTKLLSLSRSRDNNNNIWTYIAHVSTN